MDSENAETAGQVCTPAGETAEVGGQCGQNKRRQADGMVKKRKPIRPSTSRADIYVTRERRRFSSHMRRARKLLLERNYPSITIHGLGAAIQHAISLANAVKASLGGQVTMEVSTDTVTLFDDLIPQNDTDDISTQMRQNSAIHIQMALLPTVRSQIFSKPR
ncbi:hypothetical protein H4R20_004917 [Coemansia guatemalensis]|uniref:Uncharacterized protein n=1 Tax=Coemansia guatemalensis TaxID=2761395 RepID=A0A9W8HXS0_9FUNG|nr:hypothetical protein H4R20_004917 [Coemansia guatemalensis]